MTGSVQSVAGSVRGMAVLAGLALAFFARGAACEAAFPLTVKDPLLQTALQRELYAAGYRRVLERQELAVALVDLSQPGALRYAGVNDDRMLYAASLPKIAILLGVAEAAERGDIEWGPDFAYRLRRMITRSDNVDASWAAELVGLRYLAEVVRDPRYALYEGKRGGLWVGRPFRKGGETLRDPLFGISHGATARQAARFYVLLDAEKLVSPHFSRRMLSLMAPPEHFHKFVRGLGGKRGVEFVARKSGTWEAYHSDSALIQNGSRRYVLVGLAHHWNGEVMMQRLVRIADELISRGQHRTGLTTVLRQAEREDG